jgi:hypothetical protein
MTTSNQAKLANDTAPIYPFANAVWTSLFGLADDSRAEFHKQLTAVIGLVDGARQGATGYATNVSDRADRLTHEALLSADRSGRTLASGGVDIGRKLIESYRGSASQLAVSTRDSARSVADRASATAKVVVVPAKSGSSNKSAKA